MERGLREIYEVEWSEMGMGIRLGNFYTVLARKTAKKCSIRLGFRVLGLGNRNEGV